MRCIPNKRNKRGHGFRLLNGSFSRYCVKMALIWPSFCRPNHLHNVKEIVNYLTTEIQGTWSKVVFDNFYNSHSICTDLLRRGLYCLGTVKYNMTRSFICIAKKQSALGFVRNQKVFFFALMTNFWPFFAFMRLPMNLLSCYWLIPRI